MIPKHNDNKEGYFNKKIIEEAYIQGQKNLLQTQLSFEEFMIRAQ